MVRASSLLTCERAPDAWHDAKGYTQDVCRVHEEPLNALQPRKVTFRSVSICALFISPFLRFFSDVHLSIFVPPSNERLPVNAGLETVRAYLFVLAPDASTTSFVRPGISISELWFWIVMWQGCLLPLNYDEHSQSVKVLKTPQILTYSCTPFNFLTIPLSVPYLWDLHGN